MKKKGFTLIELLAVIVVLAVIALIAVPLILGVIDKSKKAAFKSSILGIMEASDLYRATNIVEYDNEDKITFTCNGTECSNGQEKLMFKGNVPISGQLKVYKNGKTEAYYLQNGDYCALGERTNLDIQKDCTKLDITPPDLTLLFIKSTTNQIIINVKTNDNESGIKKIKYEIDDKVIEDEYSKEGNLEVNKILSNLEQKRTYTIKVTVTNGNNKTTESVIEGTTLLVNSPSVIVKADQVETSGYYINQVAKITYDNTNIENPEYYIKTTKKGISNIKVTESCGMEVDVTDCEIIDETTELKPNIWYKVSGNLNVSYNELITENGTIYASIYDGTNYVTTTGVIFKTTVEKEYDVNHYEMNLDGETYTLKETDKLNGYVYIDETPEVKTYEGFTSPSTQTITISENGSNVVDYYYTRNKYTVTVNKGTGIASVSGGGTYYYGADVTAGYTLSTGYHFNNWTGDKTTATFTMPASNVTMQANGAANTYTIKYASNGGTGSMTDTTCTYNANCTLRSNAYTLSGYAFTGWTGSDDGSYTDGQSVINLTSSNNAIITMTANWVTVCSYSVGTTWSYNYTGGMQSFTVPCTGNYKLEVYGAAGSPSGGGGSGGYGGYSSGYITLNQNAVVYVGVGGTGGYGTSGGSGGYNGGGSAYAAWGNYAGAGGGATHIGTRNATLANYGNTTGLYIVAGGGGGSFKDSYRTTNGGSGGGLSGGSTSTTWLASEESAVNLAGATQNSGNAFGQGQDAPGYSGGGGGGLYGGISGRGCPGSGGSGYIGGVTNGSTVNGQRSGNGYAVITLSSY